MQCRENHYFSGMEINLRRQFSQLFGKQALLVAAPGRVNLIGEHTDYNEGFVLPGAIDKKIYIAISKNEKNVLNLYANQYAQKLSFPLEDIQPVDGWPTYLLGMIFFLKKLVHLDGGLDVLIDGDVPVGAGMSSSAALCCGFGFALNELFEWGLTKMELAVIGQKTEHLFAGVQCGIMDQFAVLHGKAGHLMKLDCRSMAYEYIPFHFPEYKIVLVNSMVSHSLAGTEYNVRRQQCEEGVSIMQKHFPSAISLRDISGEQLQEYKKELPEPVYRRCIFITSENDRLLQGCQFLTEGDLQKFGELMFQTHEGLSRLYEVSCPESDFLVEKARSLTGVEGARQMGGGFGGCTINIVKEDRVEGFISEIKDVYEKRFNIRPDVYITQIEDGVRLL
jgi:galactokinase